MKKTDAKQILEKWKDSNKKNGYQKMIATKEFLHDNSKESFQSKEDENYKIDLYTRKD